MIPRYRNKAIKLLTLSFFLLIIVITLLALSDRGLPQVLVAVGCVLVGTFAVITYIQGNLALAHAKGYGGSVVAAIIIVAGICLNGLFCLMPLVIFFGLKDKTKRKRHSDEADPEPTRRNPPAKLPPLRPDTPA